MGSGIAAHLANIGIPTLLLDIVPTQLTPTEIAKGLTLQDSSVRNRFSELALQKMVKQKPAPITTPKNLTLIEPGNYEDDFPQLKEVDWIIGGGGSTGPVPRRAAGPVRGRSSTTARPLRRRTAAGDAVRRAPRARWRASSATRSSASTGPSSRPTCPSTSCTRTT